ncbi:MAG: HEPN domain-containing protein [Nanoarchaeota archaeon]|nr:HEPN domain-containing protein [Nanoarchaeota archaeon]
MKIEELMNNKSALEKAYSRYIKKKIIQKKPSDLAKAHISKSDNNMEFVNFLLENERFYDWQIVGLYYSVYHSTLALLSKKGFSSKDHNATLCFLIKNFSEFSKEELELIEDLQIKREEIEFYSGLKEERQKASYSTSLLFSKDKVIELKEKSILLINKVKIILEE